ncbi:hypothetical protein RJD28_01095 [Oscillospiraceae bacterium NTUH-002-81]|nr:hypothetical protein RJD28_01095 [Oscillospiraceae bacterium NTUH-002-81]
MAGFMDMLGKRPETESGSSYQRTVLREVARKLNDLEEQNEQNALAIEEVRKLQRTVLQRLDAMKMDKEDGIGGRPGAGDISARTEGINDLQKQIRMLTQQLSSGVDHLGTEIGDIVRKLADLDGQIQQVQAQQEQQVQVQQEQLQQMQAQVQEEERPAEDGESLKDQLDTLRLSLEDTVHKENIKCFRNIQGALEEQGDGRSYDLNALRKYLKVIVWFQLITIALIVLRILGLL